VLWVILDFPGFQARRVYRGSEHPDYRAYPVFRASLDFPVCREFRAYLVSRAYPGYPVFRANLASRANRDFPVCREFRGYREFRAIPVNLGYLGLRACRGFLALQVSQGYRAPEPSQNLLQPMRTRRWPRQIFCSRSVSFSRLLGGYCIAIFTLSGSDGGRCRRTS
jgi:hypothetical protein